MPLATPMLSLQQRAETALQQSGIPLSDTIGTMSPAALQQTIHDLRVHQIELEMQSEELRRQQDELDRSQARYFDFYDMAPVGYCSVGESGLIEQANLTTAALLGTRRIVLVQQNIARFILPDDQDIFYLMRQRIVGTREPQSCELRFVKQDGTPFWACLDALAVPNDGGTLSLRIVMTDITERKLAQSALLAANVELAFQNEEKCKRAAELVVANKLLAFEIIEKGKRAAESIVQSTLLSTIIENFPCGVSMFDADLLLTGYNRRFQQLLDLPDSFFEKPNLHFEDIIRFNAQRGEYGPVDVEQYVADSVKRARKFESHKFERVRPNGVVLEISGKPVAASGFQTIYIDITERKQMEEQVRQLAFFDPLTKLPNRRLLDDRLRQTMFASKRSARYGAVMFLDLDNFKPLNDAHGHVVGDLLLVEVANRLTACVREVDTVARFGGDEFVVLIGELDADRTKSTVQARSVGDKILASLSTPYLLNIPQFNGMADGVVDHHCSASIGVVMFANHEASQDEVLKWADAAMYQAKDAGRNSIRFHEGTD
jgi:diguanylate cyclase (GGDEF)-like protein/PAS domain S-box-containing protein